MARFERRRWAGDLSGQTRAERSPCAYEVYLPDKLEGRRFTLDGDGARHVSDTESALARLDASADALANSEALARLLLRAESVASSRIEGLEIGGRRLLRADAARRLGEEPRDVTAREVLGNIDAMTWAVESLEPGDAITPDTLLETHRRLMAGTRLDEHAGRVRTEQNWIGGSGYNPCSASFVPPPPERVQDLLEDLCRFCNADALPALAQAAVAHAQFETIHPFVDGNGRAGRALIHLVLRRRGLGLRVLPPISLILATWSQDYIAGLTGTRYVGAPDSAEAREGNQRMDIPIHRRLRSRGGGRGSFRGACPRAAVVLAPTGRAHTQRLRHKPAHRRSARRAGAYGLNRRRTRGQVVPGDESGDRAARGGRRAGPGERGASQARLRGARTGRGVYRVGETARQSRGGYPGIAPGPRRPAETGAMRDGLYGFHQLR